MAFSHRKLEKQCVIKKKLEDKLNFYARQASGTGSCYLCTLKKHKKTKIRVIKEFVLTNFNKGDVLQKECEQEERGVCLLTCLRPAVRSWFSPLTPPKATVITNATSS